MHNLFFLSSFPTKSLRYTNKHKVGTFSIKLFFLEQRTSIPEPPVNHIEYGLIQSHKPDDISLADIIVPTYSMV